MKLINLLSVTALLLVAASGLSAQACECTDYLYLNDPPTNEIHKFSIDGGTGDVTEIGNPWRPGNGSITNAPHGVSIDLNGFIYIGDVDNFGPTNPGTIDKYTCSGELVTDNIPGIDRWGYNTGAVDNLLFIPVTSLDIIEVYDKCTGDLLQTITTDFDLGWGFTISSDKQSYYYTTGWFTTETNKIVKGNIDGSGTETIVYQTPFTTGAFMGISEAPNGDVYTVLQQANNGQGAASLYKVDAGGTLVATSPIDDVRTQVDGQTSGYFGARGLVYSPSSGFVYVGTAEDCIATFTSDLEYRPAQSVGYVAGSEPKGLGIVTECCPPVDPILIDSVICLTADALGGEFFLQEFIECDGPVCDGDWLELDASPNIVFNPCDNSLVPMGEGCVRYELTSDGSAPLSSCGAFDVVVEICFVEPLDIVPVVDCGFNAADGVTTFSLTAATTVDPDLSGLEVDLVLNGAVVETATVSGTGAISFDVDPVATAPSEGNTLAISYAGDPECGLNTTVDFVPCFDLALTKAIAATSIAPDGVYPPNTTVTFNINVCNQGSQTVQNITVKDYVPCGLDAETPIADGINPGWAFDNGPTASGDVNDSIFFVITTPLPAGECTVLPLMMRIRPTSELAASCGGAPTPDFLTNAAEIRRFEDPNGNTPPDIDSTPDGEEDNDPGGVVNTGTDNILSGDGTGDPNDPNDFMNAAGDEDDHDEAKLQAADVAIYKVLDEATNGAGPFTVGDVIKYDIGVVSQGNIGIRGVTLTDLSPAGLIFDPAFGMNASVGWTTAGDDETLVIDDFTGLVLGDAMADTLGVFDTAVVSIWLQVTAATGGDENYTNFAEIASATIFNTDFSMELTLNADGDSPFRLGRGNDTGDGVGTDDDDETLDSAPGEDIDSQDPAFVEVLLGVSVGDRTFIDVNENGIQDGGDLPLEGVTVTIVDATTGQPVTEDIFGNPIVPLMTDADGNYLFTDLPSGDYRVIFDLSTAVNGDLYGFTTANAGDDGATDSDAAPANPMDDVATSNPTGVIPPGGSVLSLDAGVVCQLEIAAPDLRTACATDELDVISGLMVSPLRLNGSLTSDGSGTFLDLNGNDLTTGPFTLGFAIGYRPSAADARRGFVNFTLTSGDPGDLEPASLCEPLMTTFRVNILKVDCGEFFWGGGQ